MDHGVLELAAGRSLKADLVIAADGVRSTVRDSLRIPVARHKYQDGIVRVLTPCDGFVGYAFPDGKTAVSPEDVSDRLVVTVASR